RVSYVDPKTGKRLVFLTNNFYLPALKIAEVYKGKWSIELFFKWIKQNLRIKIFYGNSENAVKTQIWIAVSVYLIVASLNKQLGVSCSMSRMLQILSVNPFQQVILYELLESSHFDNSENEDPNQLIFSEF
ncbi:MAG: IS4 transposase, partial [Rubritalea sp.]